MKKWLKRIFLGVFALIIIGAIGIFYFTGDSVFKGITNPVDRKETQDNVSLYRNDYLKFEEGKDIENIEIDSTKFSHSIPTIFVKNDKSDDIAVLIHGMGGTRFSMYDQGDVLYDLGYSLLIYDQRNSGDNEVETFTYGVLESFDALDVLSFAKSKAKGKVMLFGESMGGATALITASRDDSKIDYLILDCPVSNSLYFADKEFSKIEKDQGIPKEFMESAGDFFLKRRLGVSLAEFDTKYWLDKSNISTPVLIINSKADTTTPAYMGEEIYKNINSDKKQIYTEENYDHLEFSKKDPQGYKKVISNFLESYK